MDLFREPRHERDRAGPASPTGGRRPTGTARGLRRRVAHQLRTLRPASIDRNRRLTADPARSAFLAGEPDLGGVDTFVLSGGASLGLVAGGLITQSVDWHWIFFTNVPIGVFTVSMGRRRMVENEGLERGSRAEAAVNANRHETPISEERLLPVDAVAGTGMAPAR
jgi:hypothetical protein